jgi:diguanylate cyclase (GGDEF)-like protein
MPRRVVVLVASVDAAAALLSVAAGFRATVTASDLLRFAALAVLSVIYLEISRRVEHRRRLFAEGSSYIDVSSVWVFAGAIVLPGVLAVVTVLIIYAHLWLRAWRHVDGARMYRSIYTGATIVLSCLAASAVVNAINPDRTLLPSSLTAVLAVAAALIVFRAVNAALIAAAFVVSTGSMRPSVLLGSRADNAFEFSTLLLGAVTAASLEREPWFAVMVLPAIFLLQYHALLGELVQAATVDAKTELLNAAAWRQLAQRELNRAARQQTPIAVLVIDMDRFKHINDTHGHLAGDTVLRSVAEVLADELRDYDAVGRFGGEEFVALLPGADARSAQTVAERLRRRVDAAEVLVEGREAREPQRVHVTASVGVAATLTAATELDDLLRAADDALYAAKHGGRNTVRVAPSTVAA